MLLIVTYYKPYNILNDMMRTHTQEYPRSEYHTQLVKMSFDKISIPQLELVYFYFIIDYSLNHKP